MVSYKNLPFARYLSLATRHTKVMLPETMPPSQELAPASETAQQLALLRRELAAFDGAAPETVEQLSAGFARLEKQFARAGKELFKANARAQSPPAASGEWQTRAQNAEAEAARLRAQLLAAREETRQSSGGELADALLPALDGLDEALAAGNRLLEGAQPAGFWARLRQVWGGDSTAGRVVSAEAAGAWLDGADLVRERLLETLAASNVRPIATLGEPFDPHQHRAVETVPCDEQHASGAIVGERRRGYRVGDRVLRFAEVVVAKEE